MLKMSMVSWFSFEQGQIDILVECWIRSQFFDSDISNLCHCFDYNWCCCGSCNLNSCCFFQSHQTRIKWTKRLERENGKQDVGKGKNAKEKGAEVKKKDEKVKEIAKTEQEQPQNAPQIKNKVKTDSIEPKNPMLPVVRILRGSPYDQESVVDGRRYKTRLMKVASLFINSLRDMTKSNRPRRGNKNWKKSWLLNRTRKSTKMWKKKRKEGENTRIKIVLTISQKMIQF